MRRGTKFLTDSFGCFCSFADPGREYVAGVTVLGWKSAMHAAFDWVNTVLGNVKTSLVAPSVLSEASALGPVGSQEGSWRRVAARATNAPGLR